MYTLVLTQSAKKISICGESQIHVHDLCSQDTNRLEKCQTTAARVSDGLPDMKRIYSRHMFCKITQISGAVVILFM